MNVLFLTDDINYVSGVSKHLYYLLREFSKDKNYKIFLVCPGGDFVDEFRKLKITVILNKYISHQERSFFNIIKCIWFIYRFINKQNIRIIHSHTHYAANIAWLSSRLSKTITIQTIHGIQPSGGRLSHFIADYFITVNKNSINYLLSIGKKKSRIYFVNLGLPFPEKSIKNRNEIKIFFASRLVPEKGADIYLDAVSLVKDRLKEKVSFMIAGEGECENELKGQIAKLKIDVKFLGKIKDTFEYLKDSHIFVFTSRVQTEGFPLAIIEAALNGNLIITSDFISLKEIFEENKDCLVFCNNDPAQLAEKLVLAINNYNQYSDLIINGSAKAKENFSLDNMVTEYKNIYLNVK
jgi:glycosyltransferase involved in cell wall biosynthesis